MPRKPYGNALPKRLYWYQGQHLTVGAACVLAGKGVHPSTAYMRIREKKWPIKQAVEVPMREQYRNVRR